MGPVRSNESCHREQLRISAKLGDIRRCCESNPEEPPYEMSVDTAFHEACKSVQANECWGNAGAAFKFGTWIDVKQMMKAQYVARHSALIESICISVSAFVLLASFLTAEWEFLLHDRQAILNLSSSTLPKNVLSVASPEWSDNVVQVKPIRKFESFLKRQSRRWRERRRL